MENSNGLIYKVIGGVCSEKRIQFPHEWIYCVDPIVVLSLSLSPFEMTCFCLGCDDGWTDRSNPQVVGHVTQPIKAGGGLIC